MLTSSRKVVLGAALRTGNLAANAAVSLLMMPFVVRVLGDRMYGIWILVGAFVGYYGLVDLGLSSAVTRHLSAAVGAQDYDACNRVYNTSLRLFTGLGLVVLALACGFAIAASRFAKTPADAAVFWKLILILGLSLALDFPSKVYNGFLYAYLHMHLLASLDLLSLVLRTALIIAVLLRGHHVVAMAIVTLLGTLPPKVLPILQFCTCTRRSHSFGSDGTVGTAPRQSHCSRIAFRALPSGSPTSCASRRMLRWLRELSVSRP